MSPDHDVVVAEKEVAAAEARAEARAVVMAEEGTEVVAREGVMEAVAMGMGAAMARVGGATWRHSKPHAWTAPAGEGQP